MKIEITGGKVFVDGKEFVRKDIEDMESEAVIIKEVRPIYGDGLEWLQLGFEMPKMKFSFGDKIRIIKI